MKATKKEENIKGYKMTNLYTAEYEGETKLFQEIPQFRNVLCHLESQKWYDKSKLTNITPVKVVPADAIVLDKSDFDKAMIIQHESEMGGERRTVIFPTEVVNKIEAQLYPRPTPMAEPKGFTTQVNDLIRADRERLFEAIGNMNTYYETTEGVQRPYQEGVIGDYLWRDEVIDLIRSTPLEQGDK